MNFSTAKAGAMLATIQSYLRVHGNVPASVVSSQFGITLRQAQNYLARLRPRSKTIEIPVFLKLKEWPLKK